MFGGSRSQDCEGVARDVSRITSIRGQGLREIAVVVDGRAPTGTDYGGTETVHHHASLLLLSKHVRRCAFSSSCSWRLVRIRLRYKIKQGTWDSPSREKGDTRTTNSTTLRCHPHDRKSWQFACTSQTSHVLLGNIVIPLAFYSLQVSEHVQVWKQCVEKSKHLIREK